MKVRKHHVQLSLESARRPDGKHGGWRPKAGRKKKKGSISHASRAELDPRHPQLVTLRIVPGIGSVARDLLVEKIRGCVRAAHKPDFRICEFNVLSNHLHLITESASKDALARGIQGFAVRVARRMNAAMKRTGQFFAHRYHVRYLTNPTQVRNALRYVLQNRRHHDKEKRWSKTWFDPCSSAPWFGGWASKLYPKNRWEMSLLEMQRPNAEPKTWMLATGWKRLGLICLDEAPS